MLVDALTARGYCPAVGMTAQDPTHPQYRADIDGLRAVAVLAVVGYHAFPDWFRGGFVGVDVFFVISGYLISTIILRGLQQDRFLLHEFYARRVRRIFPALALVLAASFALGWFTLLPHEYAQLCKHVAGGAGFISNFVLWAEAGYFDAAAELKPLQHLWSLGVEEQYYILWPLLLFLAWRRRIAVLGLTLSILVGSFVLNVAVVGTDQVAAFYSPATRFWELMMGSSLAYVALTRPHTIDSIAVTWRNAAACTGMALIVVAVLGIDATRAFPGYWAALPTVGGLLIIAAGPEVWINRQLLAHPAAVFIGLISYPLYLWHWPSLSFVRILALGESSVPTRLGAIAASIVAAWLTYRLLERPIRFGAQGGLKALALAAVMTCIGSVAFLSFKAGGLEFRVLARAPQLIRKYATLDYDFRTDARLGTCWVGFRDAATFPGQCLDNEGSQPLVVIWGDSHAARLYPGLRRVLGGAARLGQFTRDGCPPIIDDRLDNCSGGNRFVLDTLRRHRPRTVILFGSWTRALAAWGPNDEISRKLEPTIAALKEAGVAQVIFIGPAPLWNDRLARVLANFSNRDAQHRVPERMSFGLNPKVQPCDQALANLLRGRSDVTYVSAWEVFCDSAGCLTRVDEEVDGLTTWDAGHLTTRAAEYLARRLPLNP